MKKYILLGVLLLSLNLTACGSILSLDYWEMASQKPQITPSRPQSTPQSTPNTTPNTTPDFNYEEALINKVGEAYLNGRALMRVEDEEVFGDTYAVFKVGTHTDETFITEEWLAVNDQGMVCWYDVSSDEWYGWSEQT